MLKELKQSIVEYMFNNSTDFQLLNQTIKEYRQYIFTPEGNYCIGGEKVSEFISSFEKLLKS